MNKRLIALLLLIVFSLGGFLVVRNITSISEVSFSFSEEVEEIRVIKEDRDGSVESIATLNEPTTIPLRNGSYEIIIAGSKIVNETRLIEITGDTSLEIEPDFSVEYLDILLNEERTSVVAEINNHLGEKLVGYSIARGELLDQGDWYGTAIFEKIEQSREEPDTYRVLLQKIDGEWVFVAGPKILLTTRDYPEVPVSILSSTNALVIDFFEAE